MSKKETEKKNEIIRKEYNHHIPEEIFFKGIENNNYLINYFFITTHRNLSDILFFTKKELFEFHKISNAKTKEQVIIDMESCLQEFALNKDEEIDLGKYGLNDVITVKLDLINIEFKEPYAMINNYELGKLMDYSDKKIGFGKLLLFYTRHKLRRYKRSDDGISVEALPEISYFYKNRLAEKLNMARGTIDSCIEVLENLKLIKTDVANLHKTYDGIIHRGEFMCTDYYARREDSSADLELMGGKKYLDRKFFEKDRERRINKEKKFLKKNKEI